MLLQFLVKLMPLLLLYIGEMLYTLHPSRNRNINLHQWVKCMVLTTNNQHLILELHHVQKFRIGH